jgi:HTH-type transcriptional regulator, glycine betaine synthesis regulator
VSSKLEQSKALFIRRWGEMGPYWGINRTMAEIHALLYLSTRPLCTDDVMDKLQVSRGNASMNLRALVDWGLIQRVHVMGDRKEYFVSETDVWTMFRTIAHQRKRREVEPLMEVIQRCRDMVPLPAGRSRPAADEDVVAFRKRLDEMQSFMNTLSTLFELVLKLGGGGMGRMASALQRLAGV